jgi:MFS family permease
MGSGFLVAYHTTNRSDWGGEKKMASVATTAQNREHEAVKDVSAKELRWVVFASSLGTVFEWYDFYLYATLAPFFAALFFPPDNPTAGILAAFTAYAAGFLVRPFGALVFGRLGDLIGRKYTFLITMFIMGISTFAVGMLPTYGNSSFFGIDMPGIGWLAPGILLTFRLLQGLALGGEYGGAATYVAEHTTGEHRGYATSWIQTTATVGFFMSLLVILACRTQIDPKSFAAWGWRIPFLISIVLLGFSVYIRLKLNESPVFQQMKAEGKGSDSPLRDSFFRYPNNKFVLLALLGATAGQGVVWYTGQFYALFFLLGPLKLDFTIAYQIIAMTLIIGTPFFLIFGWLSDKIGRKPIIMLGCLLAILTYYVPFFTPKPLGLFPMLAETVNPALIEFQDKMAGKLVAKVDPAKCSIHVFTGPWSTFSDCDRTMGHLASLGVSYDTTKAAPGEAEQVTIGSAVIPIKDFLKEKVADKLTAGLKASGYPAAADAKRMAINGAPFWKTVLIMSIMVLYVTMVYGPIAAYLVELFPAKIRYTSMSLPYHIGNGWFGGMLPLLGTAIAAATGNIYAGLWYPIIVAAMTLVIGMLFLRDTKGVAVTDHDEAVRT